MTEFKGGIGSIINTESDEYQVIGAVVFHPGTFPRLPVRNLRTGATETWNAEGTQLIIDSGRWQLRHDPIDTLIDATS